MTPEQAKAAYEGGKTITHVAIELRCSRTKAWQILREVGTKFRLSGRRRAENKLDGE